VHLLNPRDVVPESNMPAFAWLEKQVVDGKAVQRHMRALQRLGDPYTDADIEGATAAVAGKTELDALIVYLQGLGTALPAGAGR
jgi:cytochrome c oxidase cbb3-type subunit 2